MGMTVPGERSGRSFRNNSFSAARGEFQFIEGLMNCIPIVASYYDTVSYEKFERSVGRINC